MSLLRAEHLNPPQPMSSTTSPDQDRLPGIRHLVAVGSGKGGVGHGCL